MLSVNTQKIGLSALLISCALLGGSALATTYPAQDYGEPVAPMAATQHINLHAGQRWVNVDNGDTVLFTIDGKSFAWHFQTLTDETNLDLSTIAPPDVNVQGIRVYVASEPIYRN